MCCHSGVGTISLNCYRRGATDETLIPDYPIGKSSEGSVEFNGAPASEFETWDDVKIEVRVPVTATSGPVVVKVKGEVSNPMGFKILGPQITSIEPAMRKVGEEVTIYGTSFGSDRSKGEVFFNSIKADDIISWDKAAITVRIPAEAETGNVVVRVGGVLSNQYYYTVKTIVPEITGISPDKQQVGEWITITGANFGNDKTVGSIELNGRIIPGTSASFWNDVRIDIPHLPADAASGFLYVIVNGLRSNAVYFKVRIFYYQRTGISTNHTNASEAEGYRSTSVFGENFAEFSQEYLNPDNYTNGKNTVRGTWEIPPERFYVTDTVNLKITASLVSREGNLSYQVQTYVNVGNNTAKNVFVSLNGDQKLYSEGIARIVKAESYPYQSSSIVISVRVDPNITRLGKAITSYSYELREE